MAQYKYTGVSWQGGKVSGTVEAVSENDAMLRIHETCEVVLSLKRSLRKGGASTWDSVEEDDGKKSLSDIQIGGYRLNLKMFAVMCNQFAVILRSGMPVARAVQMVADTLPDRALQRWLRKVLRDVESGMPLADSMANRGASFLPTTFVETIRAGEASGNLDLSFENMSRHFENQYKLRAQVRSAMTYPIVLLVVAIVVMTVIMVYVIPMFTQIFEQAGSEMPALTQTVVNISKFFQGYWWTIPIIGVGVFVAYQLFDSLPHVHLLFARLRLGLPVIGKISLLSAACQFTSTMATLIGSGLTIMDATEITSNVIGNAHISRKVADIVPMLQRGSSLGDALRTQNVFPMMLTEMVALGETSGEIEGTLNYLGTYYDIELNVATSAAVKKLGPVMLIVIGGSVLFMIAGVYSGMFGMYDAMGSAMGLGGT